MLSVGRSIIEAEDPLEALRAFNRLGPRSLNLCSAARRSFLEFE